MRRLVIAIPFLLACACAGQHKMIRTLEDGPADENSFKVAVLHQAGEIDGRTTRAKASAVFERNWARAEPLVRHAAALGAKVIVTPEYGICGGGVGADECYSCSSILPKTPTEKIQKTKLREHGITPDTWDAQAAGYVVKRD